MREHGVGLLLQRRVVPLGVRGAMIRRQHQHPRLLDDVLEVDLGTVQRVDLEALVDSNNQLRERAQPRELRVAHDDIQQFGCRRAAVHALIGGAFPIEQRLVQVEQRAADIDQVLTLDSGHNQIVLRLLGQQFTSHTSHVTRPSSVFLTCFQPCEL